MASAKIGSIKSGKKVSTMKVDELRSHYAKGGKNSQKAEKELRKRGLSLLKEADE
jgi:hypothetical protein